MTDEAPRLPLEDSIDPDFLRAIGVLIVQFAMLEFVMSMAASQLIAEAESKILLAFAAINGMEVRVKLGVLQTLVQIRFGDEAAKEFKVWSGEVDKIAAQRHVAAHAFWMKGASDGNYVASSIKTVGTMKKASGEMSADDLRTWAGLAYDAATKLGDFFERQGLEPTWARELPDPDAAE